MTDLTNYGQPWSTGDLETLARLATSRRGQDLCRVRGALGPHRVRRPQKAVAVWPSQSKRRLGALDGRRRRGLEAGHCRWPAPSPDSPGARPHESGGVDARVPVERQTGCGAMIGQRIRHLRQIAGISQGELADQLSITQASVSKIEMGRRKPSAKIVRAVSIILRVGMEELTGDEQYFELSALMRSARGACPRVLRLLTESIEESKR